MTIVIAMKAIRAATESRIKVVLTSFCQPLRLFKLDRLSDESGDRRLQAKIKIAGVGSNLQN